MTLYLYVPELLGDEPWQSDLPPDEEQTIQIIDGDLKVFRVETAQRMEILEPIQHDDKDSWGDVRFERK